VNERDYLFDLRKFARKKFRKQIFEEWDFCAYCGKEHPETLDHVLPKALGGLTTRKNLIGACGECNILKSSQDWICCACGECNILKSSQDWICWFRSQDFWTLERETKILRWINQPDADPFLSTPGLVEQTPATT
jgi:hypothetical protein